MKNFHSELLVDYGNQSNNLICKSKFRTARQLNYSLELFGAGDILKFEPWRINAQKESEACRREQIYWKSSLSQEAISESEDLQ